MNAINWIAEEKIAEAIRAGEMEELPGKGHPLQLDAPSGPPELRMANKILANAGLVPPTLQLRKEIAARKDAIRILLDRCEHLAQPDGTMEHRDQILLQKRNDYKKLVEETNKLIDELNWCCIREQARGAASMQLMLPKIDLPECLNRFDHQSNFAVTNSV